MSLKKTLALAGFCLAVAFGAHAQEVGIKTNLLTDAALSPNLGIEFGLAKHWTLEIDGQINAWTPFHNKAHGDISWKHWFVSPEARWWFCEKFQGSFFGLHLLGGQFNTYNIHNHISFLGQHIKELSDYRFQGWFVGGGIGYGYAWALSKHWNIEAEVAIGYAYMRYDRYHLDCNCDNDALKNKPHNYFGLTKLALNLEYLF